MHQTALHSQLASPLARPARAGRFGASRTARDAPVRSLPALEPPRPPGAALRSERFDFAAHKAAAPILHLIDAPEYRDVFLRETAVGPEVWINRGAGLERAAADPLATRSLRHLATELIAAGRKQLDELHPCVDVTLGDGVRVHAVVPPIAVAGTVVSIRLPAPRVLGMDDLVAASTCSWRDAERLRDAVARKRNLLITGGTGAGKTTLLSALLELAPADQRIITIEDVAELRPRHPHHIALQARVANSEGAGAISLDRLLREALRMRPDRIVLGECRGPEVATLLTALNTGHDGGAGTLHASSVADVPQRLEALGALAGLSPEALARQAVAAFDFVVHLAQDPRSGAASQLRAFGQLGLSAHGTLTIRAVPAERGGGSDS